MPKKKAVSTLKSFSFKPDAVAKLRQLAIAQNCSESYAVQEAIREAWKARFPEKGKKL
jgi:hypothetical protein